MVPTDAESLLPWLVAEPYLEWSGESAIHGSTHPALESSLVAGTGCHGGGTDYVLTPFPLQ